VACFKEKKNKTEKNKTQTEKLKAECSPNMLQSWKIWAIDKILEPAATLTPQSVNF
jgi:hypothetical protein